MGRNDRSTVQVILRCCKCQNLASIWRLAGRLRDRNHIKPLFCHRCGKRTPHRQENDY